MEFFVVVLAILVLFTIGFLAATIICNNKIIYVTEMLAIAFACGTGLIYTQMFIVSWLGYRPDIAWVSALTLFDLIVLFIFGSKKALQHLKTISFKDNLNLSLLELVFVIVIVANIVLMLSDALLLPINNWDAVAIWSFKSKIVLSESITKSNYFCDPTKSFSHPEYPLLMPFIQAYVYTILGHIDDRSVRIIFTCYSILLLISLNSFIRELVARKIRLFFIASLASVPTFFSQSVSGCADVPLSFYYLSMTAYLYLWIKRGSPIYITLSALFTALAILTKNEGMGLFLINIVVLCVFTLFNLKKSTIVQLIKYIIISLSIVTPWLVFSKSITVIQEDYPSKLNLNTIFGNMNRLPEIMYSFAKEFCNYPEWNVIWILPVLTACLIFNKYKSRPVIYLIAIYLLHFTLYTIIYIISPWKVNDLINMTLSRLLIHIAPLAIYLTCEQLSIYNNKLFASNIPDIIEQDLRNNQIVSDTRL